MPAAAGDRRGFVEVAVPLPLPGPLTYQLPEDLLGAVAPGQRVRVPVGRREVTGLTWRLVDTPPPGVEVRPVTALADLEPVLTPDLLELARFAADYYLAPLGEVVAAMIPQELAPAGARRVTLTDAGALAPPRDELEAHLRERLLTRGSATLAQLRRELGSMATPERLAELARAGRLEIAEPEARGSRFETAFELAAGDPAELLDRCGRSAPARRVVEHLAAAARPATAAELRSELEVTSGVLRRLVDRGVLRRFSQPVALSLERHLLGAEPAGAAPIVLRPDQQAAAEEIEGALRAGGYAAFLLQGITGAGKTEVYLRAAQQALDAGGGVLLLVPEIALVPALARAAADRFGATLAVLHSGLSGAERRQEWERIRAGRARVVVGPRSALFAPLHRLRLVVVDEEQDLAYKQETSPRYHGRDLALVRCRRAGAVALLVSATPSLEARRAAQLGRLRRLELSERVGVGSLPEGILVDLRQQGRVSRPGESLFSPRLLEELARALAGDGQAILLRNRRGYAPMLLCRSCGEDFRCPDCGLARTYHRRAGRLICHYCGGSVPVPPACPVCHAEALDPLGAGTERAEEELARLLPGVPIDVLDRDTARRVGGAAAILERFRRGDTRVLIGTQMLSKGHHFPRVTLTGVLSADGYLGFPDFRAVERTYVLLTQLAGRSGRGERAGRVVLQTFRPEHYAIQAALRHDDAAFAEQELRFREVFGYPPFSRLVLVLSRDRARERARDRLREFAERLGRSPEAPALRVSGPAPAPLERLRGEWRFQCIVRAAASATVRRAVAGALGGSPGLQVDVDPYQLL